MLDKPKKDMIEPASRRLAGEKFSADEQCKLVFGPESRVCSYMVNTGIIDVIVMLKVFKFSRHVLDFGVVVMTMLKAVELNICHGLMELNAVKIIGVNGESVYIVTGMLFKKLMEDGVLSLREYTLFYLF